MRNILITSIAVAALAVSGTAAAGPGKAKDRDGLRAPPAERAVDKGRARNPNAGYAPAVTPGGTPLPPYRGYRPVDGGGVKAGLRVRSETGQSLGRIMRTRRAADGQTWVDVVLPDGKVRSMPARSIHVRNGVGVVAAPPVRARPNR